VTRWVATHEWIEHRSELAQECVVEPGPRAASVDQCAVDVVRELQRSETRSIATRLREAHDDEVARLLGLDLEPLVGAPTAVGRIRLLRDDPFEA
jgi:hypothetical protein